MNRREFLSRVADAGARSTAVVAATAVTAGSGLVRQGKSHLGPKLEELEARFDKLEHHHKNLVRVGALAFAVSTGVDVLAFL